jgi:hypothetical protein
MQRSTVCLASWAWSFNHKWSNERRKRARVHIIKLIQKHPNGDLIEQIRLFAMEAGVEFCRQNAATMVEDAKLFVGVDGPQTPGTAKRHSAPSSSSSAAVLGFAGGDPLAKKQRQANVPESPDAKN